MAPSPRWLEGWGLLLPSVGIAAVAAWLALPQPTFPEYLPLPTLDPHALTHERDRLLEQAERARRQALPYAIRAVGERFRQFGVASHQGIALSVDGRERYRAEVKRQLAAFGGKPLLELRAIQTELFVSALAHWETTRVASADLTELGGDLVNVLERERLEARALRWNDDERRAAFLLRWTDLAGLAEQPEFRLPRTWLLLSSRFRLRRPLEEASAQTLSVIDRVADADPEYPAQLARGLVLAQLGQWSLAAERMRSFLEEHPDGPYSSRARNHLLYVLLRLAPGNLDSNDR